MKEFFHVMQIGSILGSGIFFIGTIFAYYYQESSQGMLPVIHYPFRELSGSFLIITVFLLFLFLSITIYHESTKQSTD
ncbi:MAG: hypothetical protein JSW11_16585 [Candidatus Heimdallarchaeota archaeon]|nr:MAG: hypothetical protein JSW11_16585 [Candidatus Heimdallarchaeota archaeon]